MGEKEGLSSRIFSGPPDGPQIIFFPAEYDGEAEITKLAEELAQFGMTLIVPQYPMNSGQWPVISDQYGRTSPLVLMGRSTGSALALETALINQESVLCLIMESANDTPENRKKMAAFKKPVLFLHSSRDEMVSLSEIEWLVAESRSKATQFQIVPSPSRKNLAASTGEFYFKTIRDFIHLRMGIRPKRKKYRNGDARNGGIEP